MCIIIDANCAAKFANGSPEAAPIAAWLRNRASKVALGGSKLAQEFQNVHKILPLLNILRQRGQLKVCDDDMIDNLTDQLAGDDRLHSDDPHIIAIALSSGARVLYSNDENLHRDFTNRDLINPRGRVYQDASHAHVLRTAPRCAT